LYFDLAIASSELGSPRPLSCESSDSLIAVRRAWSATTFASSAAIFSLSSASSGLGTFFRSFSVSNGLDWEGASAAGASLAAFSLSSAMG